MSPRDELYGQCPGCGNAIPRCACNHHGTPTLEDCIEWMGGYVFTDGRMPSERVCQFLNQDIFPAVLSYLRQYQQSLRYPPPVVTTPEPAQEATNSAGAPTCPRCDGDGRVKLDSEERIVIGEDWADCPDCNTAEATMTVLYAKEHSKVPCPISGCWRSKDHAGPHEDIDGRSLNRS